MVIRIIGKAPVDTYRATCQNTICNTIIEFNASDILEFRFETYIASDGQRRAKRGVRCPDCYYIVPFKAAEKVDSHDF